MRRAPIDDGNLQVRIYPIKQGSSKPLNAHRIAAFGRGQKRMSDRTYWLLGVSLLRDQGSAVTLLAVRADEHSAVCCCQEDGPETEQ